jgi:hypothetical protein
MLIPLADKIDFNEEIVASSNVFVLPKIHAVSLNKKPGMNAEHE